MKLRWCIYVSLNMTIVGSDNGPSLFGATSHYLNYYWFIINIILNNKFYEIWIKHKKFFKTKKHLKMKLVVLLQPHGVNPSTAETGIFQENMFITKTVDDLVRCITRPSPGMVLTTKDKQVIGFHEEGVQLSLPSKCWEMRKCKYVFMFPKINSVQKGLRGIGMGAVFLLWSPISCCVSEHNLCVVIYTVTPGIGG